MPDALADVRKWAGQPVTETPIKGGLSHRIARLDAADGQRWLLRVLDPRVSEAGLGIPLDQEIANTLRAADAGVGPRGAAPDAGALLLEYLDGTTLDAHAVRTLTGPDRGRLPPPARRPRFVNDFSIFGKLDRVPRPLPYPRPAACPTATRTVLPAVAEIERGAGRRSAAHGAVPQRPAAGEPHPLRRRRSGSSTTSSPATTTRPSSWATSPPRRTTTPT